MKNKKGSIALYIWLFLLAIAILIVTAVLAPAGVLFNTELTKATENIKTDFTPEINKIDNVTIRNSVLDSLNSGTENNKNMVEVNSYMYRWSGILLIAIPLIALFIFSRITTEKDVGGLR